jgi:hypothetical protein
MSIKSVLNITQKDPNIVLDVVIKIRTGRPRKRGSVPDRGNRYFNSPKRLPIVNRNKNPSAHKHVGQYVSWNPYIVASHLKILTPVCTEMVAAALSPSVPAVLILQILIIQMLLVV